MDHEKTAQPEGENVVLKKVIAEYMWPDQYRRLREEFEE